MKPSPYVVAQALHMLDANPGTSALIGDSPSDVHSARAAGVHSIGFANKPGKHERLSHAGAEVVVTSLKTIITALAAG